MPSGPQASAAVPSTLPEYEWKSSVPQTPRPAEESQRDRWDAAAAATSPKVASDSWSGVRLDREKRSGSLKRGVVAAMMVVVGTGIGIALYAGGSGFLSDIFSNKNEGVEVLSPSAVTERPQELSPNPASVDPLASSAPGGDSVSRAMADQGRGGEYDGFAVEDRIDAAQAEASSSSRVPGKTPSAADARTPAARQETRETPARAAEPPKKEKAPALAEMPAKGKTDSRTNEKTAAKKPEEKDKRTAKKEESTPSSGKYMVQVRATSDESEANLIAKRLRKKGISNVQIVRSEKNGAPFFRVRFSGTGKSDELQAKAKSAGYSDVWVVRQK